MLQIVKFIFRILILDIPLDLWLCQNTLMPQCIIRNLEMEHFCSKVVVFVFYCVVDFFFLKNLPLIILSLRSNLIVFCVLAYERLRGKLCIQHEVVGFSGL